MNEEPPTFIDLAQENLIAFRHQDELRRNLAVVGGKPDWERESQFTILRKREIVAAVKTVVIAVFKYRGERVGISSQVSFHVAGAIGSSLRYLPG